MQCLYSMIKSFLVVTPQCLFIFKTMCLFVGSEFPRSHYRLHTPSYTFTGFHCWTHMYNKKYRGFHPRGCLSLLAITREIFSFPCIQSCDFVGRRPNVPSPPSNTKHSVDHNYALTPIQCDVPVHMQCNAPLHVILCHMYDECYMDNIIHTTC